MQSRYVANISEIDSGEWNALVPDDAPFARHEFLQALETSGCVQAENGWLPQHIILEQDKTLVGAMPFYIKGHSYGEYVFDWAWADAYHRHGYEYYPKGLCAIPFTPASCPKILVDDKLDPQVLSQTLLSSCMNLSQELNLSSVHSLFLNSNEQQHWQRHEFISRTGFQFHWHNHGFSDFSQYLDQFSSSKRKKIRHERKSVKQQNIKFKIKKGQQIELDDWENFHRFYESTIRAHGAMAYLNEKFFISLGKNMAEQIIMILAYEGDQNIASALYFEGEKTLFGRYWGCDKWIKNLHFELCYYQAIEYCINQRLSCFEAGAQGEHKLSRGLLPVKTQSSHWLKRPEFFKAIENHLKDESIHIQSYLKHLEQHSPFKAA